MYTLKLRLYAILFQIILILFFSNINGQIVYEDQILFPSDGINNMDFGNSVSISGDFALIGSYRDFHLGYYSGSVYIYQNNSGIWEEYTKLYASDSNDQDCFGVSVDISGNYAVVGADQDDDNGYESGSVYIFKNNSGTWEEYSKLLAPDGASHDDFGESVCISGNYIFIGASGDDDNGSNSGSVYVFYNNSEIWEFHSKITPDDGSESDHFGIDVAVYGDYAIIGANWDDDSGSFSGSVYIYYNNLGTWEFYQKLLASDGDAYDGFGNSVDISDNYAIIGADHDDDYGNMSGSAYIFKKNVDVWQELTKLTPNDLEIEDWYGCSVGITDEFAVVGAVGGNYGYNSGTAYIYMNSFDNWEGTKVTGSDCDYIDYFGTSVCISDSLILIGASKHEFNDYYSGTAYSFDASMVPYIIGHPTDQLNICNDENINFTINSINAETYQWQVSYNYGNSYTNITDGDIYFGSETNTLSVNMSPELDGNYYSCLIFSPMGSVRSLAGILTFDILPPDSVFLEDLIGECTVTDIDIPVTTDNCTDQVTATTNDPLNYFIPGNYIITWNFEDENGNSVNIDQNIFVIDSISPTIVCVSDQEVIADESHTYTISGSEFDPVELSENCGVAIVENDFNYTSTLAGAQIPEGLTTIIWTMTDLAGNDNSCSFDITVNDYVGFEKLREKGITFYPNPTEGKISFVFTNKKIQKLTVSDIIGKKFIIKTQVQENEIIDLSHFKSGIYIISIQTGKKIYTAKIMKK